MSKPERDSFYESVPAFAQGLDERLAACRGAYDAGPPGRNEILPRVLQEVAKPGPVGWVRQLPRRQRLVLAGLMALCLAGGVTLLPRVRFTEQGLRAAYPPAWAEHENRLLIFDFGPVIALQPGEGYEIAPSMMTLSMAQAIVERLRAEVAAFNLQHPDQPRLSVVTQRVLLTQWFKEDRARPGGGLPYSRNDRYAATMILPDPELASALKEQLGHVPLLPAAQAVDGTAFSDAQRPGMVEMGATIGVELAHQRGGGTVKVRRTATGIVAIPANPPPQSSETSAIEYFSYPRDATESQIEAQLTQWLKVYWDEFDCTASVSLAGWGENKDVVVAIDAVLDTAKVTPATVIVETVN